jgi:Zn-dependent M32 family carboxypeptidase
MKGLIKVEKVEKWYTGKKFVEILDIMTDLAKIARKEARIHNNFEYFNKFLSKFGELKSEIAESKTWLYDYYNDMAIQNLTEFDIKLCQIRQKLVENKPIERIF